MCIVFAAYKVDPRTPLVLLANRDEFFDRPTERMHVWDGEPPILAGRDLKAGGTWMGLNAWGEVALLTNFREPGRTQTGQPRSRGRLVLDYLGNTHKDFTGYVRQHRDVYSGFNLLFGPWHSLKYVSNRAPGLTELEPGVHGLSNAFLNTSWPKVERGVGLLKSLLAGPTPESDPEPFFALLQDRTKPPEEELPDTGLPRETERALSSIFIEPTNGYGTRSGTVVVVDAQGRFRVWERDYLTGRTRAFANNWWDSPTTD